jgi:hypothetical protein
MLFALAQAPMMMRHGLKLDKGEAPPVPPQG